MQISIFASEEISHEISVESNTDKLPEFVAVLQSLYDGFASALHNYRDALSDLKDKERELYPKEKFGSIVDVHGDLKLSELKYEVARCIRSRLIEHAQAAFGDQRAKLIVDVDRLNDAVPIMKNKIVNFSAAAIWRHLVSEYSGEKGQHASWKHVANEICSYFNLDRDSTIKRTHAFVTIDLYVGYDSRTASGDARLSLSGRRDYANTLLALSQFCQWAQFEEVASNLQFEGSRCNYGFTYTPREKLSFGADSEIVVTTYLRRFEFRFTKSLAEQLLIFIGTYRNSFD